MKVLALNGSPQRDGNTAASIGIVLAGLEKHGIETELVQVGGSLLHGCKACYACHMTKSGRCAVTSDPMNEWIEKMMTADGILLGSPVYFYDVSSEMIALIDRAGFVARGNDRMFKHKVGAALVVKRRTGAVHALDTLNHFFSSMQMFIVGGSNNLIADKAVGVENDAEGIRNMQILGENMALLLKMRNSFQYL
jgi:multimeric flavodoxin WrbA